MAKTKDHLPMSKLIIRHGCLIWENKTEEEDRDPTLGPSYICYDGYITYETKNKCHNPYGPAIIWSDGEKEYCLNGEPLHFDEWLKQRKKYL